MNLVLNYSVTTEDEKNHIQNKTLGTSVYVTDTKENYIWDSSVWVKQEKPTI